MEKTDRFFKIALAVSLSATPGRATPGNDHVVARQSRTKMGLRRPRRVSNSRVASLAISSESMAGFTDATMARSPSSGEAPGNSRAAPPGPPLSQLALATATKVSSSWAMASSRRSTLPVSADRPLSPSLAPVWSGGDSAELVLKHASHSRYATCHERTRYADFIRTL